MNAELRSAALGILADATEPVIASALADELGITTPKATNVLKAIDGVKVSKVIVGNRVVNGYSL